MSIEKLVNEIMQAAIDNLESRGDNLKIFRSEVESILQGKFDAHKDRISDLENLAANAYGLLTNDKSKQAEETLKKIFSINQEIE